MACSCLGKTEQKAGNGYTHGRRNWGHRGYVSTPLFKDSCKVPLSCNLVALLENIENAQMNRKIDIFSEFRRCKSQNFQGSMPPDPLDGFL